MPNDAESGIRSISVEEFLEGMSGRYPIGTISPAEVLRAHSLTSPRVQKLGLALSGFAGKIHKGRIQIFGNSERSYLSGLSRPEVQKAYGRLDRDNISCILVTAGIDPSRDLVEFCFNNSIPLLATTIPSSDSIASVASVLSEKLAPEITIHGSLMEIFGVGVLIIGDSGIGKSECALDLITRGHRLISDDSVRIRKVGDRLIGSAPDGIRDFIEIRGLGIINARDLFGVSALSPSTEIRFSIEFTEQQILSDRLGMEPNRLPLLGVEIQKFPLPVRPGRNLATLAEASVRVFVSAHDGRKAVDELISAHSKSLEAGKRGN